MPLNRLAWWILPLFLFFPPTAGADTALSHLKRGILHGRQGNIPRAITHLNQAIHLKPDYAEAFRARGITRLQQDKPHLALADFTQAITLKPGYIQALYNRGSLYHKQGRYRPAIKDFTRIIRLDPTHHKALNKRGLAFARSRAPRQAMADFTRALNFAPRFTDARFNRANLYLALKQYNAAIADFTRIIRIDPRNHMAFHNRGNAHFDLGNLDQALADFTRTITLKPDHASGYNALAWFYATCTHPGYRNGTLAVAYAQKALALNPSPAVLDTLGAAHVAARSTTKAMAAYHRAMVLDHRFFQTYRRRLAQRGYDMDAVNHPGHPAFKEALLACIRNGIHLSGTDV